MARFNNKWISYVDDRQLNDAFNQIDGVTHAAISHEYMC